MPSAAKQRSDPCIIVGGKDTFDPNIINMRISEMKKKNNRIGRELILMLLLFFSLIVILLLQFAAKELERRLKR